MTLAVSYVEGRRKLHSVSEDQVHELCNRMIEDMEHDRTLMMSGRRNDDTVNLLICCKIADRSPDAVVENSGVEHGSVSWNAYQEHKERIEPYLEYWCPEGEEHQGYDYIIDDARVMRVHRKYFGEEN